MLYCAKERGMKARQWWAIDALKRFLRLDRIDFVSPRKDNLSMNQILVELPAALAELPPVERDALIRAGLYEATRARRRELEALLTEATMHLQHFEQRYGLSFERFEAELLPTIDSPQAHEDYNDWFFWQSVRVEQQALLVKLQQ